MKRLSLGLLVFVACARTSGGESVPRGDAGAREVEVVPVVSKKLDTTTHLEGELTAFESVAIHARTNGFVSRVNVDRGSSVKRGDVLVVLAAPELAAQRTEVEAKLQGERSTLERLRSAAKTVGAVSDQELDMAAASVRADEARVQALRAIEQYLVVTAPFDGIVTERNVHPGALVGPQAADKAVPMLRVEQVAMLRLTVPVPESLAGDIPQMETSVSFTVRAWPAETFSGSTVRVAHTLDPKTRSMAVELDVVNTAAKLAPGMFADVVWPVRRAVPSLFVPANAVVTTTERSFVVRIKDGAADPVTVQRGLSTGELVEVFGELHDGDVVAKRGSEELRAGTKVATKVAPKASSSH